MCGGVCGVRQGTEGQQRFRRVSNGRAPSDASPHSLTHFQLPPTKGRRVTAAASASTEALPAGATSVVVVVVSAAAVAIVVVVVGWAARGSCEVF